jgi:phage shock protein C
MKKRLYRDEHHKVIAGVCAGLADYFDIDVSIIRVLFLATLILKGGGIILYIILWIVVPKKNYIFTDPSVDYQVPPNPFGNVPPYQTGNQFTGIPQHRSNGRFIAGAILIILGGAFLLNEFDIIPDFDFSQVWPVILIVIGAALIFNGQKKQPW